MVLSWTRTHSLRVALPPGTDATTIKQKLRSIPGVTGSDSTPSVLTMGFARRYNTQSLRRGPYRKVRKVLIEHGVITPGTRAQAAA